MAAQPHFFPHQFVSSLSASPAPGTSFPDWPARPVTRPSSNFSDAQRTFETQFIHQALREHRGNISRTADAIGMSRRNLQLKIQKLGIDIDAFRPAIHEPIED
ncbi:MAG TPA: helix-turn-helix domain-containing protein [bacterium]|jgi:DNA-binding NtrC family response regulator